jgi:hypothetical protein
MDPTHVDAFSYFEEHADYEVYGAVATFMDDGIEHVLSERKDPI